MEIDVTKGWTISQTLMYDCKLDNGNGFSIIATNDNHDGWSIDDIMFDDPSDDTEENRETIESEFMGKI